MKRGALGLGRSLDPVLTTLTSGRLGLKMLVLCLLLVALTLLGAAFAGLVLNRSAPDALWWAWSHILDPGFLTEDSNSWAARIVGSAFAICGLTLIGGAFVVVLEDVTRHSLDALMHGRLPNDIEGHTVIFAGRERLGAILLKLGEGPNGAGTPGHPLVIVRPMAGSEVAKVGRGVIEKPRPFRECWQVDGVHDHGPLRLEHARRIIMALDAGDRGRFVSMIRSISTQRAEGTWARATIYLEVGDAQAASALTEAMPDLRNHDAKLDVHVVSVFAAAARVALRDAPLDHAPITTGKGPVVHLVVVGFSRFAEAFVQEAARTAHFASRKPTRYTFVVDPAIHAGLQRLARSLRHFADVAFAAPEGEPSDWELGENQLVTVLVAGEDPDRAFAEANRIKVQRQDIRSLLVELPADSGYRDAMRSLGAGIQAVGGTEDIFHLAESLDVVAMTLHAGYLLARGEERNPDLWPADRDWAQLDDVRRNWNRSSADHLPVKVRALNDMMAVTPRHKPIAPEVVSLLRKALSEKDPGRNNLPGGMDAREALEVLASVEHNRWAAEKFMEGWKLGPKKSDLKRESADLIAYHQLDEKTQEYDRENVIVTLELALNMKPVP